MLPPFFEFKKASGGDVADAEPYFLQSRYVAQEKFDGIRCILQYELDGRIRIYTRIEGKNTGVPGDKSAHLQHIADEVRKNFQPGVVLDGEVIVPRRLGNSISSEVMHAAGGKAETAVKWQQNNWFAEFVVFDVLAVDGTVITDKTLGYRLETMRQILPDALTYVFPAALFRGEPMKRKMLEIIWRRGGEGLILKDLNSVYDGKRNEAWVKVKAKRTYDVVFMGIESAEETSTKTDGKVSKTKYAGQAGAIIFGQFAPKADAPLLGGDFDLVELGRASGFDDAERRDVTEHAEEYVGRVFTIKAQGRLKSGKFRSPRTHKKIEWRDDKSAIECTVREDEA